MFGFGKKEVVEFNATNSFMVDMLHYDAGRKLIKIKNVKQPIKVEDIQLYSLKFGEKTYNKASFRNMAAGGILFGAKGAVAAAIIGGHKEEYVSNITITIKANDKFHFIPLTIGKTKLSQAKGILTRAEEMIAFLDEITMEG